MAEKTFMTFVTFMVFVIFVVEFGGGDVNGNGHGHGRQSSPPDSAPKGQPRPEKGVYSGQSVLQARSPSPQSTGP
jgi:hypothetical protein